MTLRSVHNSAHRGIQARVVAKESLCRAASACMRAFQTIGWRICLLDSYNLQMGGYELGATESASFSSSLFLLIMGKKRKPGGAWASSLHFSIIGQREMHWSDIDLARDSGTPWPHPHRTCQAFQPRVIDVSMSVRYVQHLYPSNPPVPAWGRGRRFEGVHEAEKRRGFLLLETGAFRPGG